MILPITLTMAGAATLLNVWMGGRVSRMRVAHKVSIGDGGSAPLLTRMRAHSNFVEYTPFFLILLGGLEMARGSPLWLWLAGMLFILARILHAFGMDRPAPSRLRMIGMVLTVLILLALALYAIAIASMEQMDRMRGAPVITYAAQG
jgi:uncharacterized membrane protein YecN with MAPEG domain